MEGLFVSITGTNPIVQGFAAGLLIAFLKLLGALGFPARVMPCLDVSLG